MDENYQYGEKNLDIIKIEYALFCHFGIFWIGIISSKIVFYKDVEVIIFFAISAS